MNNNNSYLTYSRKLSENIAFKIIWPILIILFVVFNPISIFIIACLISIILIAGFKRKFFSIKSMFLMLVVYAFLMVIYSMSPKLQYYEFSISHYNWAETDGNIKTSVVKWRGGKNPRAYANVEYTFLYRNQVQIRTEYNACENFQYILFKNLEENINDYKTQLTQKVNTSIKNKDYKILVNVKNGESKLFIPLDYVFLKNSAAYNFISKFGQFFLAFIGVLLLILLISILLKKYKPNY